ncbi:glutamate 5-kinase [Cyclobacterium qasimii]|uniref:Glutamate 5-kinase n=2 Tax=Cyclobacterium qasimii TaxID=1350429 RepID=S7V5X9_9BACT|nr:glutamate 5-kinase [Cyclobacterium qasimii]EPR65032.1 Glutamate 5-kinase [Cyclobacterium qasimii M12-11B]GEO20856.1 glutamate 5-kinase [Cyclobacterium qasimii]
MKFKTNTIVIKIGSNVLTMEDGSPDLNRMASLVDQMVFLLEKGVKVVLVTSGAVAFGRKSLPLTPKTDAISKKQVWAAIGQIELIRRYKELFSQYGHPIAQLMVTKEDFRDRTHYLNMKNCLDGLLKNNVVPVINENDAVAVTELMFTDNDELAGLVAAMIDADSLLLLTNVDGIYKGHPADPSSELITFVGQKMPDLSQYISTHKSSFGRGGMLTKMTMAKKSANLGIEVLIANGKKDNVLVAYFNKELKCTYFEPGKSKDNHKKWIAHSENYSKGEVTINEGAQKALESDKITSLLPVGILSIKGEFLKGDIIRIVDPAGNRLGLGKAEYNAKTANEKIGLTGQKPLIHYDYLYISELN